MAPSRRQLVLHDELASGGTATVHIASLVDPPAPPRVVAVKRLKDGSADPELVTMLFDEARCAKVIHHPNVVPLIDAIADPSGVLLVFEYVHGETLSRLCRACAAAGGRIPVGIAAAVVAAVLDGLDAAHEATDIDGTPLQIVHRDVSPQNVMIGEDGVTRVVDFGIAKAVGRLRTTRDGTVRGKIGYLAPEQLTGKTSRQSDVFSAAVILWELLVGRRLYAVEEPLALVAAMQAPPRPPSSIVPDLPPDLDRVVLRGLARDVNARYATAREMARDLAASVTVADRAALAAFVIEHASAELERRHALVRAVLEGRAPRTSDAGARTAAPPAPDSSEATAPLAVLEPRGATARPAAPPPARSSRASRRVVAGALFGILLAAAMAGAIGLRNSRSVAVPARSAPQSSASSLLVPSAEPALEADAAGDLASRSLLDAQARTPPPKRKQRPASAGTECDPPYTLSEDGARRIPKRECFR